MGAPWTRGSCTLTRARAPACLQLDAVRQDSVRLQAESSALHLRLIQQAETHDAAAKQVREGTPMGAGPSCRPLPKRIRAAGPHAAYLRVITDSAGAQMGHAATVATTHRCAFGAQPTSKHCLERKTPAGQHRAWSRSREQREREEGRGGARGLTTCAWPRMHACRPTRAPRRWRTVWRS